MIVSGLGCFVWMRSIVMYNSYQFIMKNARRNHCILNCPLQVEPGLSASCRASLSPSRLYSGRWRQGQPSSCKARHRTAGVQEIFGMSHHAPYCIPSSRKVILVLSETSWSTCMTDRSADTVQNCCNARAPRIMSAKLEHSSSQERTQPISCGM